MSIPGNKDIIPGGITAASPKATTKDGMLAGTAAERERLEAEASDKELEAAQQHHAPEGLPGTARWLRWLQNVST